MYVWRNVETRSCNHCCNGKAINITYFECVFVALNIQHEMRVHHIVICDLPGSIIFFHYFINVTIQKKKVTKNEMRILIFSKTLVWNFSHFSFSEELSKIRSKMCIDLHVEYWSFLSDFIETCIFSTYFRKMHKYQISWKYVQWEPSCSMWTDRQTWRIY
jgi:hypothetical protein